MGLRPHHEQGLTFPIPIFLCLSVMTTDLITATQNVNN